MRRVNVRGMALAVSVAVVMTMGTSAAYAGDKPLVIEGAGRGHGIGMSQWAANARAQDGQTYDQILDFYYDVEGQDLTQLVAQPASGPVWVGLEQEAIRLELKPVAITAAAVDATLSWSSSTDAEGGLTGSIGSVTVPVGSLLNIRDTGSACSYAIGAGSAKSVPCNLDLEWDGWTDSPTTAIEFPRSWELGTNPSYNSDAQTCARVTGVVCTYDFGGLRIRPDNTDGVDLSVELGLNEYVKGIGEVPTSWPTEALKVQAVASRTYGEYLSDTRGNAVGASSYAEAAKQRPWCWCTIYDGSPEGASGKVSDQVYRGRVPDLASNAYGIRWRSVVDMTSDEIVTYQGNAIAAFFSASNGGATQNNEDVWSGAPIPYLRSRPDPYSFSPLIPDPSWTADTTTKVIESKLGLDTVTNIDIVSTYDSGVPKRIVITGTTGGTTVEIDTYGGKNIDGRMIQGWFNAWPGRTWSLPSAYLFDFVGDFAPATAVDRWWSQTRYDTAVEISKQNFPDPSSVDAVIVATGLNHPDALASATLARKLGAPVLLVTTNGVPAATMSEIERLDPATIYILGGPIAVDQSVEDALAAVAPTQRLAGETRYDTAVEISKVASDGPVDTVYVASGMNFPGALVAGPIAAANGDAILLVPETTLTGPIESELTRLSPSRIVVVGDSGEISDAVLNRLGDFAASVVRVSGADRYETSVQISQLENPSGSTIVFVATGAIFPDALAGGGVAGDLGAPILLVGRDTLPPEVAAELQRLKPDAVYILGGPAAVSDSVYNAIVSALS